MDDPLVSESDYDEEEYDIRDNIIAAIDDLEATYNDFVNKDDEYAVEYDYLESDQDTLDLRYTHYRYHLHIYRNTKL